MPFEKDPEDGFIEVHAKFNLMMAAIGFTVSLARNRDIKWALVHGLLGAPYVADVVAANLAVLDRDVNGVFNVGTGVRTSDQQVFEAVRDAAGVKLEAQYAPRRKGEVEHISLTFDLAKRELGWEPQVDFAEGVKRAMVYYTDRAGS